MGELRRWLITKLARKCCANCENREEILGSNYMVLDRNNKFYAAIGGFRCLYDHFYHEELDSCCHWRSGQVLQKGNV